MSEKKCSYLAPMNRLFFWFMNKIKNPGAIIRRQIIGEIQRIQGSLDDTTIHNDTKVHELRKSIKRMRSLLRLLKSAYKDNGFREMDNYLKLTGRSLTELRESVVNQKVFDSLIQRKPDVISTASVKRIQQGLNEEVKELYKRNKEQATHTIETAGNQLTFIKDRLLEIQVNSIGYERFIDAIYNAFTKAYNTYHKALHSNDTDLIHSWRKYAKYLLLQFKLSPMLASYEYDALREQLDELTDLLGDEHDLAVLEEHILKNFELLKKERKALLLAIDKMRFKLQQKAFRLGDSIFSQPLELKERRLVFQA